MANEVRITVTAQDKTKGVFNGVKAGMKTLVSGAAVLGAGLAVAMVKASAAARESSKIHAQTAAVIKSTGGAAGVTAKQVSALSERLSNMTGIDDEVIQSGANMLLTFTNIRNNLAKNNQTFHEATAVITDMSVALGQDMKSSAMQVGKALNDPIKGITALKRVGVTFNEQQIKTIKHLVKTGDVAGAQAIILKELRKEFGGSAEAQATWADKAKVAAGNIQEAFGDLVNKTFAPIGKWFVKVGAPAIEKFFKKLEKNKELKVALERLGEAVKGITDKDFGETLDTVADQLPKIAEGMADAADAVGEFYDAIVAVNSIIGKENRGGIFDEKGPLGGATKWIKKAFGRVWEAIKSDLKSIGDASKRVWGAMKDDWHSLKDGLSRANEWLKKWGTKFVDFFKGLPGKAKSALKSLAGKISEEVEQARTKAVDKAKALVTRVVDWFKSLPGKSKSALSSLASKVASEVEQTKDRVLNKVRDMVTKFIDRMQQLVRQARDQAGKVKGAILSRFAGAGDWLESKGRAVIDGLLDGLKYKFNAVKRWVSGIAKWIKDHKGPLSLDQQLLVPAGKALMGGLLEGLKFGFGGVGDFVFKAGTSVKDIIGQIKDSFLGDWSGKIGSLKGGGNRLLNAIRNTFGIGGGTYPGHGERGAAKSWDFMARGRLGDAIAAFSKTFARQLGVLYVIWNRRIWNIQRAGEGWRPYTRSNPHTDHVHVSLRDRGGMLWPGQIGGNMSGQPERVLSPTQTKSFDRLVRVMGRGGGAPIVNNYYSLPNYVGSTQELVNALTQLNRQGRLQVIKR